MAPESVSFRITRNTEDLVQTIHALSHRLVTLEQKLDAMQLQLNHRLIEESSPDPRAVASLDTVERLLHDCRCLLGLDGSDQQQSAHRRSSASMAPSHLAGRARTCSCKGTRHRRPQRWAAACA